ncbi:MAG: DUF2278 family protein [Chitinivibrionales bacterium]|nr:DUF2278 family protein [Chitinivibrionales bacterium]
MPLKEYGVLKGFVVDTKAGSNSSPHYEIRIVDSKEDWRIAVNTKSQASPSDVLYIVDDNFNHPLCDVFLKLPNGYTSKKDNPQIGLDFIRSNLFKINDMIPLPCTIPGPNNDLNELIDKYIQLASRDENVEVYAFGERWPKTDEKDKYFGFRPQQGIHDIHMNQGNAGKWKEDDGVRQDGALLIYFSNQKKWVAIFLAFQSQSFHTDDTTGHTIDSTVPHPDDTDVPGHLEAPDLVIVGALINPVDDDYAKERVYLFNRDTKPIQLSGWAIADKSKKKTYLNNLTIAGASALEIKLDGKGAQLSNKGDIISLLDPKGIKHFGVSFTKKDIQEGKVILF